MAPPTLREIEESIPGLSSYTDEELVRIESLKSLCSKEDVLDSTMGIILEVLPVVKQINVYIRFIHCVKPVKKLPCPGFIHIED